ncbi:sporulation protein YpjB [Lentibacillus juripiscarius]|uniref:Sporulation protein YpjB n=1 Tax=Lentibacillus juripiscarius TaxID=257446 RepID=A0ABW5V604_9BACI
MNRTFTLRRMLIAAIGIYSFLLMNAPTIVSARQLYAATETAGDVKMIPFYWIVGIVGGSIAITLTYVGWKKYKGEEKKQSDDDANS